MAAIWRIPQMTNPLGRHWRQPDNLHERVGLYWNHATIAEQDWLRLPRYDSSYPTGAYPGKAWRRRFYLCFYGPLQEDGSMRIVHLRALVQ